MMINRLQRIWAVLIKEFIQIKRDRGTVGMILGLPLVQIILFGCAINTNPHHLPAVLVSADHSVFTRAFIQGLENTGYFHFTQKAKTIREADDLLKTNQVQFIFSIPSDFTQKLIRAEQPEILVEADATDPSATSYALTAVNTLIQTVFTRDFQGTLSYLLPVNPPISPPVKLIIHSKYNPQGITQYSIVPGLLGVVLTMTMVMITAIAITRERERGTMESLLSTPVRASEVMMGKIMPYVIIGYMQAILILSAAFLLFSVPHKGSIVLLFFMMLPFIAANLAVGLTMSTLAKNQLQAMQSTVFFFLPSLLLSGFMFPFSGMPAWAQLIGNLLPLTHFLHIVRGILLKGSQFQDLIKDCLSIFIFLLIIIILSIKRFRKTLD